MSNIEYRTYDGYGNNLNNPHWGRAGEPLLRLTTPGYYQGKYEMAGQDRPNPRVISNKICKQTRKILNKNKLSDFVWAWGQFLDHEMDLTPEDPYGEEVPIWIPKYENKFGGGKISFKRSIYSTATGCSLDNPRQQLNVLSSFIDAANVYGTDGTRAKALRSGNDGKMKVGDSDLLPTNDYGLPNAEMQIPETDWFFAGDVRANEHSVLTSMHTLFVREHNQLCDELKKCLPAVKKKELGAKGKLDEYLYQRARKIVGALMQVVTYEEFIPAIFGDCGLKSYAGYKCNVNPSISNIFSTACYRLGHSMLSPDINLGKKGDSMALRDSFFKPDVVRTHGITPFLQGLATQVMQEIDVKIVDEVREFLFHETHRKPNDKPPRLLDLAALNIQRGRDHGLPDYNQCRLDFGLPPIWDFGDITSDAKLAKDLASVYGDVNKIDPWIGGLAEDHLSGSNLGELIFTVLKDQFERLRDGDRFWYENDPYFSKEWCHHHKEACVYSVEDLKKTRLSHILKRNGVPGMPKDVFIVR